MFTCVRCGATSKYIVQISRYLYPTKLASECSVHVVLIANSVIAGNNPLRNEQNMTEVKGWQRADCISDEAEANTVRRRARSRPVGV